MNIKDKYKYKGVFNQIKRAAKSAYCAEMQNICFGTFVKLGLIKNNDIYTFVHLSAIMNLCKLYNRPIERCGSVKK